MLKVISFVFLGIHLSIGVQMNNNTPKLIFSRDPGPSNAVISRSYPSFSIPKVILNYITDNIESPTIHEKLIANSKYFFFVNSYLRGSIYFNYFEEDPQDEIPFNGPCCFRPTFENIDSSIKFWIIDKIFISNKIVADSLSAIIPRTYRCDITDLMLSSVNMTFDEFMFISNSVKDVHFGNVKITYSNGEIVLLEDIIDNFPKLVACSFSLSQTEPNVSSNTTDRILQSPRFSKITDFCIVNTPELFDITKFVDTVKDLELPRFWFHISDVTSGDYELQLEECVNTLVALKCKNRMIQYSNEDPDNYTTLLNRYDVDFIRILTMG